MKKDRIVVGVVSFILGAALFGGGTVYAATGILAERSQNTVYVDGQRVELEAYIIGGNNYVKLRDIGKAVNFNVFWDGTVQIDSTAAYTGVAPETTGKEVVQPQTKGTEDYSAAANPAVFKGVYSREAYNAAYTVLSALRDGDESCCASLHIGSEADRWKLENMIGNLSNGYTLSLRGVEGDTYEIYAVKPDREIAKQYTADLLFEVGKLPTDKDKVIRLNKYLCDKVIYDAKKFAGLNVIASASEPVRANCDALSSAMNELCAAAGIPCFKVCGENHAWNLIYCNGQWSYTDVSVNDLTAGNNGLLFSATHPKQIEDTEGVRFLQELLIPGSTK